MLGSCGTNHAERWEPEFMAQTVTQKNSIFLKQCWLFSPVRFSPNRFSDLSGSFLLVFLRRKVHPVSHTRFPQGRISWSCSQNHLRPSKRLGSYWEPGRWAGYRILTPGSLHSRGAQVFLMQIIQLKGWEQGPRELRMPRSELAGDEIFRSSVSLY